MDQWCEWGIIGLAVAVLIFGPLATGAVRTVEFLVLQGLVVLILGLWILRLWLKPRQRLLWPPICWSVAAFTVYAIIRYFQADIEYVARQELIRILLYAFFFIALLNNLHRQDVVQVVVAVLISLAVVLSAYALYQFVTNSNRVWHFIKPAQYMKRGSGTYICPNHLAGFLELILPLALSYLLMGKLSHVTRILVGYASLVILAGLAATVSRGGWIAAGISLMVLFAILIRIRSYRLPSLIAMVILVGLAVNFVSQAQITKKRFGQMFTDGKVGDFRFRVWEPAVQIWKESPWLGVGPAHFDYRFREYRPVDVQMTAYRVHNDYLNTLVDFGVIGGLLVASAFVLLYAGVFKTWKYVQRASEHSNSRKSNKGAFVMGASIGLLAILLHSVVDFNMHIPANAILTITLMALLSSHLRFATDNYWLSLRRIGRPLLTLLLLSGALYLGSQATVRAREHALWQQAQQAPPHSLKKAAILEKAFEVEDKNFETAYAIGECWRVQSWQGEANYRELARKAMHWFEISMRLNPYDGYSWMRYGMCLHWLGRHPEAGPYFDQAAKLDPNGYYMVAHQGWHRLQLGDLEEARAWFVRSLQLKWPGNPIAAAYRDLVDRKLKEETKLLDQVTKPTQTEPLP